MITIGSYKRSNDEAGLPRPDGVKRGEGKTKNERDFYFLGYKYDKSRN